MKSTCPICNGPYCPICHSRAHEPEESVSPWINHFPSWTTTAPEINTITVTPDLHTKDWNTPLPPQPATPVEDTPHSLHHKVSAVVARFKELRPHAGNPKRLFLGIRELQQFMSLRASGLRRYEFKDRVYSPHPGDPRGEFCGMQVFEVPEINYLEVLP